MKSNLNKNYIYILAACTISCVIYLIFEFYLTGGRMGVPLDDTWIHFQFADNFSKGYFYQYNPGEYSAGTTSPLYVIVLAIPSFISQNFLLNSIVISTLFYFLCCIFIYKISLLYLLNDISGIAGYNSRHITPKNISLLIAILTALTGRFVWSALSGMETTMFTFFCILGIYFHMKNIQSEKFNLFPALYLSLAALSRPEGYLLFGIYLFDVVLNLIKGKRLTPNLFKLILAVLLFLVLTLPYLLFSYSISGNFFPNTFRGQGGGIRFIPDLTYLRIAFTLFFRDNFITGILYLCAIIFYFAGIRKYFKELKNLNLTFLWIIFLPIIMSVLIPNWRHHVRYLIPLIPFINFIAVYILLYILNLKPFVKLKAYFERSRIAVSMIVMFSLVYFIVYAVALGKNTDNINSQQVKLAEWVNKNVGRDETIALNDIGAITFINKNKIIDMAGLVTPEILKYRQYTWDDNLDSLNYLLKKNKVSYIIIYDNWFKEYLGKYGSNLTFVTSAYLEDNTICGGDEMKIYKTNFTNK